MGKKVIIPAPFVDENLQPSDQLENPKGNYFIENDRLYSGMYFF